MKQTRHPGRWLIALLFVALPACADKSGSEEDAGRATVTPVEGTDLSSVTLTDQAAKRIGIELATVQPGAGSQTKIPYAAVLYDPEGGTWTFTASDKLTFVRAPITVDRIEGDVTYLTDGPAIGTEIVTVGATELYGAEIGVGDE